MRCARNPPLLRAGKRRCHVHVRSLICQSMSKLLTHDEAMGGVIGRTLTFRQHSRRHPNQQIGSPCQEQQGRPMARMRMSMKKIREVLRLTHELGLSVRQVREATGVGVREPRQGGRDHVADPAGGQ
jgi:hypothetical protein